MLNKDKIYYTYRDLTILPCVMTDIEHRSECCPFDDNGMLPLFTAPMDTVVGEKNYQKFIDNKINAIIPRTVNIEKRLEYSVNGKWAAYSKNEFEFIFCNDDERKYTDDKIYALIDIANGHMKKNLDLVKKAKEIYGDKIVIMLGNIANPLAYKEYADAGVDYCRIGIGAGNGCLSTSNTGVHMPMASLIDEVVKVRDKMSHDNLLLENPKKLPYIVADGGIRNYSDIIKALALGADYVMVGSVFAQMIESSATKDYKLSNTCLLDDFDDIKYTNSGWVGIIYGDTDINVMLGEIFGDFYGMASREGQIALNGAKTKTSEGVFKKLKIKYTMKGWCNNFIDYLRSAMSYTGHRTLEDLHTDTTLIINSENAINVVNK